MRKSSWHRDAVTAYAAATNRKRVWDVTWNTQRRRCCGRVLTIADEKWPPVRADRSDGAIAGEVTQCPSCGALYTAHFSATERTPA